MDITAPSGCTTVHGSHYEPLVPAMTAQVLHQNLEKEIGVVVARRDTAVVNLQCIGSDGRLPTPCCDKDGPLAGQFSVLSAVPLPHGFAKLLSLRVSDSSECMCRGLRCWLHCRPCLLLWSALGPPWGVMSNLLTDIT